MENLEQTTPDVQDNVQESVEEVSQNQPSIVDTSTEQFFYDRESAIENVKQAIQMQAEMDMRMKQMDMQMQQRMKELDMMIKDREIKLKEQEVVLSNQQAKEKIAVDREKLESERDIELKYLDFQKQELAINARTQRAQVLLQDMKNKIEVTKSRARNI